MEIAQKKKVVLYLKIQIFIFKMQIHKSNNILLRRLINNDENGKGRRSGKVTSLLSGKV